MSLTKFNEDVNNIQTLPDKPAIPPQQLKARFDKAGLDIKQYINEILTIEIDSKVSELTSKINSMYPIGSIYMSVNNTNPSTLFGGTWVSWGAGKAPVGVNLDEVEFDEVEKIGGEKTHTLTTEELAVHNHDLNEHTHGIPSLSGSTNETGAHSHKLYVKTDVQLHGTSRRLGSSNDYESENSNNVLSAGKHKHTVTTNASTTGKASGNTANSGSGQAHNNLQPYITCYMWKRTA